MRVLVDTNVVVSALLFGGRPAELLLLLSDPPFELWTSAVLIEELADTLSERKFSRKLRSRNVTVERLLQQYVYTAFIVPEHALTPVAFKIDPDDAPVIATALAAEADWLISGDHHLLDAHLDLPCEGADGGGGVAARPKPSARKRDLSVLHAEV